MKPTIGICSNVDLRTLDLVDADHQRIYQDPATARASLLGDGAFWSQADHFLVFLDVEFGTAGAGRVLSGEDEGIRSWFAERLTELEQIAANNTDKSFVIANVALVNDNLDRDIELNSVSDDLAGRINGLIAEAASRQGNVTVMDWARQLGLLGAVTLYDPRYWYMARMPLSKSGAQALWNEFLGVLDMATGDPKKVLCVDLDNTLWRGLCGEEGPRGVGVSEEGADKAFRDFQARIRGLKDLGVLLAINSKNNAEDALAVFRDNPMMILHEDDFAAMRINWGDKSENMRSIAEELSLDLGSFVFIDDSSVERELVRAALPEVVVPEFPDEAVDLPVWLSRTVARHFRRRTLTSEDRRKTEQYSNRRKRASSTDALSRDEAIRSLRIGITVECDKPENLPRLHQMAQKTNQFNLTTLRYTEAELRERIESPRFAVFDAWYRDRFGDEGIVALAVVELNRKMPRIESFVMSCRVIGRGVEYALLGAIGENLAAQGFSALEGRFEPTPRNAPCSTFLSTAGFAADGDSLRAELSELSGCLAPLTRDIETRTA